MSHHKRINMRGASMMREATLHPAADRLLNLAAQANRLRMGLRLLPEDQQAAQWARFKRVREEADRAARYLQIGKHPMARW